jgi:membrane fusion protein, copper/silver efflux system
MYADVEIATGTDAPVVTVSSSAVIDSGERQLVLLDKGEGRFEPRTVKLGRRGGGLVEVKEGLAENDKVVSSANFLIDAESNLKAALKGLDTGEKSQ